MLQRALINNCCCPASTTTGLLTGRQAAIKPALRRFGTSHRRAAEAKDDAPPKGIPYSQLSIGVPKETFKNERRVSISPAVTQTLVKKGFTVNVEEGAGDLAKFSNAEYETSGGKVGDRKTAWASDIVLRIRSPETGDIQHLKDKATLISFIQPAQNKG